MDSVNFLKDQLLEMHNSLPYLEIRYEYKVSINTHVIEVKPVHCFQSDSQYVDIQIVLEDEFEMKFPDEEILFISTNELINIDDPILELGVSDLNVTYDIVIPEFHFSFKTNKTVTYDLDDNIKKQFDMPPPDRYKPSWWKLNNKLKKDSEHNSESFFLYKFGA